MRYTCVTILIIILLLPAYSWSQERLNLLLTSNIGANFSTDIENQEKNDPMFLLAQTILQEKRKGNRLWFDLGNAFYPGPLSKFSYGSAMMDFFQHIGCEASLVSSDDIRVGLESLVFLNRKETTDLISANIIRDGSPVFRSYVIRRTGGRKLAFIGLSSMKIRFDMAEKNVNDISLRKNIDAVKLALREVNAEGVESVILLSGLEHRDNVELLNLFQEIDLVIAGGDNIGKLASGRFLRMDMADGRSIVLLPPGSDYYLLDLALGKGIAVTGIEPGSSGYRQEESQRYREFRERITRWKDLFRDEMGTVIIKKGDKPVVVDHERIAALMRHLYRSELAVVKNDSVEPLRVDRDIATADVLGSIEDNYNILVYKLTGKELLKLEQYITGYTISGYENSLIQGYRINEKRHYRVVSTQSVFEEVNGFLKRKIPYENTWENITDIVVDDLKGERVLLKDNYRYLERRFRATIDIALSAFYEATGVIKTRDVEIPAGMAEESYARWGGETEIDFSWYNVNHFFTLTPYVSLEYNNYEYLSNLMRGTLYYNFNASRYVNIYHKYSAESAVFKTRKGSRPASVTSISEYYLFYQYIRRERPAFMRQTLGPEIDFKYITFRVGAGYEKHFHDPVTDIAYGIEGFLGVRVSFLRYFKFTLQDDVFYSLVFSDGTNTLTYNVVKALYAIELERYALWYLRNNLDAALTFTFNDMVGLSLRYKWYIRHSFEYRQRYSNSKIMLSLDMNTDFKIF